MPGAMESKGDGEYPYSAPFTGLNTALPSILLPPSFQEAQTSPSFTIVRGSLAAPWPFAFTLFGASLASGEYFLFATASGYVFTNLHVYQLQSSATPAAAFGLVNVAAMPTGAFPAAGSNNATPFIETNGSIYFACLLGIYRYANGAVTPWSVTFTANFLTIFNQRMVVVGTRATSAAVTPGTPTGTPGGAGTAPAATYYAVVTALFAGGVEGTPSAESAAVVLGAPGNINWSWTAVAGATGYNLYIGQAPGQENAVFSAATNAFNMTTFATGTAAPPSTTPLSPVTVAWSAVSTFSATSIGSFNANPNTNAGVVGGFDVLTNYSQGVPSEIINLGHSIYIQMTQGIVEMDPAASGSAPFTFYNYWQSRSLVGAYRGTVAQYGPVSAFVTPDNVNIWVPGSQQQIGGPIIAYLRNLMRNMAVQEDVNAAFPLLLNPPASASFYTLYGELHYALTFNVFGIPPVQAAPPYPVQPVAQWFGLILDYNMISQAWTQQVTPPLTGQLYQIVGPPLTTSGYSAVPMQNVLIAGTQAQPGAAPGWIVFAPDVFNQQAFAGAQCQGLQSVPQRCMVGFPQSPISAGHRITVRRVRIEYGMDEDSCATQTAGIDLTVSLQGTITTNTGNSGGNGVASSTVQSISRTFRIQPPGAASTATGALVVPFLTATAYADMVLSCENPQVSLSWTDPSAHQRLLVHRVTLLVNDTKGTTQ